jgi:hypothetical protein
MALKRTHTVSTLTRILAGYPDSESERRAKTIDKTKITPGNAGTVKSRTTLCEEKTITTPDPIDLGDIDYISVNDYESGSGSDEASLGSSKEHKIKKKESYTQKYCDAKSYALYKPSEMIFFIYMVNVKTNTSECIGYMEILTCDGCHLARLVDIRTKYYEMIASTKKFEDEIRHFHTYYLPEIKQISNPKKELCIVEFADRCIKLFSELDKRIVNKFFRNSDCDNIIFTISNKPAAPIQLKTIKSIRRNITWLYSITPLHQCACIY